jgi:hypothetical protein
VTYQIVRVTERFPNHEDDIYLSIEDAGEQLMDGDKVITPEQTTAEELGELLDQDAESGNHHGMVGFGCNLAILLEAQVGEEKARLILWQIALIGGYEEFADYDTVNLRAEVNPRLTEAVDVGDA